MSQVIQNWKRVVLPDEKWREGFLKKDSTPLKSRLHDGFEVLRSPMGDAHNGEHWVNAGGRWEGAGVGDKEAAYLM